MTHGGVGERRGVFTEGEALPPGTFVVPFSPVPGRPGPTGHSQPVTPDAPGATSRRQLDRIVAVSQGRQYVAIDVTAFSTAGVEMLPIVKPIRQE